ncbi:MAG: response regulator, partial [Desulfobacterium sp.]|nr:response regulator [Desulfobacterium sp.]
GESSINITAAPFDLTTCCQGDEAVEAVKQSLGEKRPFALVFLDVHMPPGPDGVLAARQIRKLDPDIEIVIVTAYSYDFPQNIIQQVPPAHKLLFIQKPLYPQEIYQFAISLCSKWEVERELIEIRNNLESRIIESTQELVQINIQLLAEIEERKSVEKALKEIEIRYRMLFENASEAIFLIDAEEENRGKIVAANRAAGIMHGYTVEELLKLNIIDLNTTDIGEELPDITRRLLKGNRVDIEIEHYRKDGTLFPVESNSGLLELGNKKYVLTFDRDITFRKQALEEKEKLLSQIRRSEKMEAIGTLAGGVAHDLNNILSAVISYPELILMDLTEESLLKKQILTIQKSGEKAAAIVQDLLTLARRGVVVNDIVNLNDIVNDYLNSAEYKNLKSYYPDVQIKTLLKSDLLNILGSPIHLSKTIMNLVSNAAEAIGNRGTITISVENQYIDRPIKGFDNVQEGDYVVLKVSDDGIGIPEEHIEKIFEPFYTKKKMGRSGTGLGMTVIWGTVMDHNGYIDVQSAAGKGTTIKLYFPITRELFTKNNSKKLIENFMGNGESILVVDDVEEQLEIANSILIKLGYSVNCISSGEKAVEYLKNNKADLLILDMIMDTGIDGLDTYRKILEVNPAQKAIIASGFSETYRVKETLRIGAGAYIKKPYTIEKIGVAVKLELSK